MASDRERARSAIVAMKNLGISNVRTKAALKRLLKVYAKNWDLIEEEGYRVLADTLFQEEEDMAEYSGARCNSDDEDAGQEPEQPFRMTGRRSFHQVAEENKTPTPPEETDREPAQGTPRPLKRLRGEGQVPPSPPNSISRPAGIVLKEPELEIDGELGTCSGQQSQITTGSRPLSVGNLRAESLSSQPQENARNKGKEVLGTSDSMLTQERACLAPLPSTVETNQTQATTISQMDTPSQVAPVKGPSNATHLVKPQDKADKLKKILETHLTITPKEEPISYETSPDGNPISTNLPDHLNKNLKRNPSIGEPNCQNPSPSKTLNGNSESNVNVAPRSNESPDFEPAVLHKESLHLDIASSANKEVKVSVSVDRRDLKAFSPEELLNYFEAKCLRTYKIHDSNFSARILLDHLIESVLEVGTNSTN